MRRTIEEVIEYREFLKQYVLQNLRNRYRGSVMGFLWTLLNPLLLFVSLSIVFAYINRADVRAYGPHFFAGYLAWTFFLAATGAGVGSIVGNANFVTRIYLPKAIFPLAATLMNLVDLGAALFIVLVLLFAIRAPITPALLILPVSMLILVVLCLGLCFLFGALNVFLRDFQYLWGAVTFLWFFFSPILFQLKNIPEGPRAYFALNPIIPFLDLFQQPIEFGVLPSADVFLRSSLYAVVALVVGVYFFVRSEKSFYLYL